MSKVESFLANQRPVEQKKKITFEKVPLIYEILAGGISGFLVSPFNTIVDRSVIQNANGKMPLWRGVANGMKSLFTQPHIFLRTFQFKWLLLVYTSTYISSNLADHGQVKGVEPSIIKLMITFVVNTTASLIKDKALTQRFGTKQKKSFPMASFGYFFLRDIVAMASAFTIPPILGQFLSDKFNLDPKNGLRTAQIISPMLVQFIGTPLHLLGLDYYNNQNSNFMQRMQFLRKVYLNSLAIRILRFFPTYGLGGIVNIQIRSHYQQKYSKKIY